MLLRFRNALTTFPKMLPCAVMEVQMPLLTVNIAAKTFDEITRLVGKGLYSGMDQFIEVAALNQLALERGVSPEELMQKGHREPPTSSMAGRAPTRAPTGNGREKSRAPLAQRKATSSTVPERDVATLTEHTGLDHWSGDGPAPMPAKSRPEGEH